MIIVKGGIQCKWSQERRARSHPPRVENHHRQAPVPVYVPPPPESKAEEPPPPDDCNKEWIMSGYGHDQFYINAAMLEWYRDDDTTAVTAVDYKEIAQQQCTRLEREGATKRSIEFL